MAIRFKYEPAGSIVGLAAYATGDNKARARSLSSGRRYPSRTSRADTTQLGGQWIDPLDTFEGPEEARRLAMVQQRAQMNAVRRDPGRARKYGAANLLPRWQSQAERERKLELYDEQRKRNLELEDEQRKRGYELEDEKRKREYELEDARRKEESTLESTRDAEIENDLQTGKLVLSPFAKNEIETIRNGIEKNLPLMDESQRNEAIDKANQRIREIKRYGARLPEKDQRTLEQQFQENTFLSPDGIRYQRNEKGELVELAPAEKKSDGMSEKEKFFIVMSLAKAMQQDPSEPLDLDAATTKFNDWLKSQGLSSGQPSGTVPSSTPIPPPLATAPATPPPDSSTGELPWPLQQNPQERPGADVAERERGPYRPSEDQGIRERGPYRPAEDVSARLPLTGWSAPSPEPQTGPFFSSGSETPPHSGRTVLADIAKARAGDVNSQQALANRGIDWTGSIQSAVNQAEQTRTQAIPNGPTPAEQVTAGTPQVSKSTATSEWESAAKTANDLRNHLNMLQSKYALMPQEIKVDVGGLIPDSWQLPTQRKQLEKQIEAVEKSLGQAIQNVEKHMDKNWAESFMRSVTTEDLRTSEGRRYWNKAKQLLGI